MRSIAATCGGLSWREICRIFNGWRDGADVLALLRFDGTDHLNDLFEYRVEALSTRDDLDFDALIGTHASVEIEAHDQMRPFDGIVTLRFWPTESGLGNTLRMRARFGHAAVGSYPDPFSDRPYAVLVDIRPAPDAPAGFTLEQAVAGQPLLTGQLASTALTPLPGGGIVARLQLDVQLALPPQRWKDGQQLSDDAATRVEIESLTRRAHAAFGAGRTEIIREMGPMLQRLTAAVGITVDPAMERQYAPHVDTSLGFELQPFDASGARLVIFGEGRLAALIPPPVVFTNAEIGESAGPMLAYWHDASGSWQIMH